MHTKHIADTLLNSLLAYHSNKEHTILTKNQFLRGFLEGKIRVEDDEYVTKSFIRGILDKSHPDEDFELLLESLYQDILKLVNYLENPKLKKRSLQQRVHFLAKRLSKSGFVDLVNFNSAKKPFPDADKVIYLDSELYKDFLPDGSLPEKHEIIIRFKSHDCNYIKEQALKSGLLLEHRASNNLETIHDFVLYPGNNPPRFIAYSYYIKV